jgi:hypothetical protein
METKSRCDDLIGHVLDTQNIISEMPTEKVRMLLVELDLVMEEYTRDIAIIYIAGNYSSKKHLCATILRGKHDSEIREAVMGVREILVREISGRKKF